jgi:acyl-CoA oxidase
MINSELFHQNTGLSVFLPLYALVWADGELATESLDTVRSQINRQAWLNQEEKDFLISNLNPDDPPNPDQLNAWQNEILKVKDQVDVSHQEGVMDIGLKLMAFNQGQLTVTDEIRDSFSQIDDALGALSRESVFILNLADRIIPIDHQHAGSTFDILVMNALLEGDQAEIIERVKSVLCRDEFAYVEPDNLVAYRERVLSWCRVLAAEGFGAVAYPKEFGGEDKIEDYFTILETMSMGDLSLVIKFGVQFGLFGMSVYFLGTPKHHRKYLAAIGKLELPGCFAMTETGHGSNVRGIETTAVYDHEQQNFTIHTPNPSARKEYIGNAACHGQMATVFAKLIIDDVDYGVNGFLVPLRDSQGKILAGISIEDCGRKMGLNGVDNGVIVFDKVVIPKENMLDQFASVDDSGVFQSPISSDSRRFFTMIGTLVGGRIGIPRSANAASKSGLTIAIKYGDKRRQFGSDGAAEVPILDYRTHQRRLLPHLATTYALHFSLRYLTHRFLKRKPEEMKEIEALAAGLKAYATWHTTETLQECREACGGKGYLSENRIDALKNDTEIYTTFEGDNTVLMQLVAKSRLSQFKQDFGHLNLVGMVTYVVDQAKTSITEMNPVVIRNTDPDHLLDAELHLSSFSYRERDILTSAAKRLKKHLEAGMDSFDAFNQCQFHLVNAAFAYVERVILEQFQTQVNRTADPGCQAVLRKLCQLHALSQIEKNKGWYLEHDYMAGVKTIAIRKLINQLCWEIRKEAVPLVDAFQIPDVLLSAPIIIGSDH